MTLNYCYNNTNQPAHPRGTGEQLELLIQNWAILTNHFVPSYQIWHANWPTVSVLENINNYSVPMFLTSNNRDGPSVTDLFDSWQAEGTSTNDKISLVNNPAYPSNLVQDTVRCRLHCTTHGCYENRDISYYYGC